MNCTVSEAKKKLNSLVNSDHHTTITRNGKPVAAIVPYDEYIKMFRLMRENEDNESIAKAEAFFKGEVETVSQEEVDNVLKEISNE